MAKCRISILKKTLNQELIDEYVPRDLKLGVCNYLHEGQEFIVEHPFSKPEGFCNWAWTDIMRDVTVIAFGGDFPWMRQRGVMITACTDGLRPVIFKLERID